MTIAEIEDLIIERIKAAMPYVPTVESYQGQLEADLREYAFRFPVVFVAMSKSAARELDFDVWRVEYRFDLNVVARNLRGQAAGRRESQGAYEILGDLRSALVDTTLGVGLLPVALESEEALIISRELVAYGATYRVEDIDPIAAA